MSVVCALLALLGLLAGKIPFYVYDEEKLHTTWQEFWSLQHLRRMIPLGIICAASVLIIVIILAIRRKHDFHDPAGSKEPRSTGKTSEGNTSKGKTNKGCVHRIRPRRSIFHSVRWILMITFSLVVMFGGILTGLKIRGIDFPVLDCPTNLDQMLESSCYYLAHLPVLFEELTPGGVILFFASTIGFTLLFGRIICGFLCPMGLIQDIMHLIRQKTKKKGLRIDESGYAKFVPVRWMMVILMFTLVFAGGEFCWFCPALATSPVMAGMQVSLYLSGFMMIFVLVGSFFKRRFWCNICPLGYLIGLAHRISPFRIKKDTQACTECGACYEACPMGIKMIYTERQKTDVTDINCIMCGECVRCCPEDHALAVTFAGMKLYEASRSFVMSGYEKKCCERK